ncbi:MAG: tetratricopeptide repeat protein [Candidatus Methylomirabilales bacterium]
MALVFNCPNCGLEFATDRRTCPVCQGPDFRRDAGRATADPRPAPPLAAVLPLPVHRAARRRLIGPSLISAGILIAAGFLTEVALRGAATRDAGTAVEAAAAGETAVAAPEPPPVSRAEAERFNSRGVALARAGELDAAILQFTQAITADPTHYKSHNNLGVLYKRKGFIRQAIQAYKTASQIQPDNPVPYKNLAILYEETAGVDEALANYAKYLELAPEAPDAATVRARVARLRPPRHAVSGLVHPTPAGAARGPGAG